MSTVTALSGSLASGQQICPKASTSGRCLRPSRPPPCLLRARRSDPCNVHSDGGLTPRRRLPRRTRVACIIFSAGPATLPRNVLETAQAELVNWHGSGMSVMEMSHRGKEYLSIIRKAEADLRALLAIPTPTRCSSCRAAPPRSSPPFRSTSARPTTRRTSSSPAPGRQGVQGGGKILQDEPRRHGEAREVHGYSVPGRVEADQGREIRAYLLQRDDSGGGV
ncbi:hypothetical protein CLOM_g8124 [Closterium sp. NIES-68]|nr:hypothetical protein CLOM_g8124 [Closterium sp. NIES-68]